MIISDELGVKLIELGIIPDENDSDLTRTFNVGDSDYAKHIIQPWSVWIDWNLNPWDADIVKRVARNKSTEDEKIKYLKIKHICDERLRQLDHAEIVKQESIDLGE